MQWTNEEKQEWLDYVFQHNYNHIEQAARRLGEKGGQFSLEISSQSGQAPQMDSKSKTITDIVAHDSSISYTLFQTNSQ